MTSIHVPVPGVATACPKCGYRVVSERDAAAWCPQCEWNLATYEPSRRGIGDFGWTLPDRWAFRVAYRQNARQFKALAGREVTRPGFDLPGVLVLLFALVMLALVVAILATGVWVLVTLPAGFATGLGLGLIGVAVMLRPQFGKVPAKAEWVGRTQAPALYALLDEVAAAVGTRPPDVVVLTRRYDAFAGTRGWRRRRTLGIGLPLWAALTGQQRVALLGHELGHFVNGDVRRSPVQSLAFTTLERLSDLTRPQRQRVAGGFAGLAVLLTNALLFVVHTVLAWLQVLVTLLALRSVQRAEYYADEIAARVGGTDAAVQLCDALVNQEANALLVRRDLMAKRSIEALQETIRQTYAELIPRMPARRQLSARDGASLFATHPPAGLRAAMIASRPAQTATVALSNAASARVDAELAGAYAELGKVLAYQ